MFNRIWNAIKRELQPDPTVEELLQNDDCKKVIHDFIEGDLSDAINVTIIYQLKSGGEIIKTTKWDPRDLNYLLDHVKINGLITRGEIRL